MPIEVKEIIVRTTVTETSSKLTIDQLQLKRLKNEIVNELKQEYSKVEKRKRKR